MNLDSFYGSGLVLDSDISSECGGITRNSLSLLEEIIKDKGVGYFVKGSFRRIDGIDNLVLETPAGDTVGFTGLTCGYGGEGARGSQKALKLCGFDSPDIDDVIYSGAENLVFFK